MDLEGFLWKISWLSFPHTRGDGPIHTTVALFERQFSPHTWGWTFDIVPYYFPRYVFPTHVGMDLIAEAPQLFEQSFPHTRGDGPGYI